MSSSRYNIKHPRGFPQRLDGGLNSKFESSIIDGAESTDCLNVVFSAGSVATRLGSTKLNTTLVGSSVCDGLYTRRDDGGSETMIAFHGGSMHGLTGSTFVTISSAESVFTAGERIAAAQYRDNIFVGQALSSATSGMVQRLPEWAFIRQITRQVLLVGRLNVRLERQHQFTNSALEIPT